MDKVYIGKIVATHGIKGEVKIISDFPYKEKAFRIGSSLLIDQESLKIERYRQHQNYDMITFCNYHDINEVEKFIQKEVYKEKEELQTVLQKKKY